MVSPRVTWRLQYSVCRWPRDLKVQSLGDPETQIISNMQSPSDQETAIFSLRVIRRLKYAVPKWPTLRYSVYGWPGDSNIHSLGDPNYWKIPYNPYWLQPLVKSLIAYRVRIEPLIMRIDFFFILVFQQLCIEPNIRRIERVSNCVSQPSLGFLAYRNLRIETVSRDMRICVSYRGNAKIYMYTLVGTRITAGNKLEIPKIQTRFNHFQ